MIFLTLESSLITFIAAKSFPPRKRWYRFWRNNHLYHGSTDRAKEDAQPHFHLHNSSGTIGSFLARSSQPRGQLQCDTTLYKQISCGCFVTTTSLAGLVISLWLSIIFYHGSSKLLSLKLWLLSPRLSLTLLLRQSKHSFPRKGGWAYGSPKQNWKITSKSSKTITTLEKYKSACILTLARV